MNINQPETLFWGGPIHGETRRLLGGCFYVPVLEPLENTFIPDDNDEHPTTHKMFKTTRYNLHQFTWQWKNGFCSGFAMIPTPVGDLCWELERILDVLGGLWGGGNGKNEGLYARSLG